MERKDEIKTIIFLFIIYNIFLRKKDLFISFHSQ